MDRARAFEVLVLSLGASAADVKAAHRRLVHIYHPDRYRDLANDVRAEAASRMREANIAYDILTRGTRPRGGRRLSSIISQTTRRNRPPNQQPRQVGAGFPFVPLAALLLVLGLVVLMFGMLTNGLMPIYASIGLSTAGAVAIAAGVVRKR